MERLLLDYIYEHEERRPTQTFLTQPLRDGQVVDYDWGQVLDQARRMASHLGSLGFERGARIAILSKNNAHFIMAELAIWMGGFTTVAIFPNENPKTISYILDHSDARLLFIGKLDDLERQTAAIPPEIPCIAMPMAPVSDHPGWDAIVAQSPRLSGKPGRRGDELMFIVYTSGSTGTPKGVMHSFERGTRASEGLARDTFGAPSASGVRYRVLSYLPLPHIYERAVIECASLVLGSTQIYFNDRLETFQADLRRARPTQFISVPRLWFKFQEGVFSQLSQKKLDLLLSIPVIRTIVRRRIRKALGLDQVVEAGTASAPMPVSLLKWYRRLDLNLSEGLGMTEDFAYSHIAKGKDALPGSVGLPRLGVERRIAPDGELLLRSPGAFVGYHKRPDLDAEAFTEDGFFRTGDLAVIVPSGELRLTGRKQETFKTAKGKFVAPAPIEALIEESPLVELSLVTGAGLPAAYAVVAPVEDYRIRLDEPDVRKAFETEMRAVLARVNEQLADHEYLSKIVVSREPWTIENGCLTPTMKIKRRVIEDRIGRMPGNLLDLS